MFIKSSAGPDDSGWKLSLEEGKCKEAALHCTPGRVHLWKKTLQVPMPGNGLSPFCVPLPSTLSPWEQLLLALESKSSEWSHSVITLHMCSCECFIMVFKTKANMLYFFYIFMTVPRVIWVRHRRLNDWSNDPLSLKIYMYISMYTCKIVKPMNIISLGIVYSSCAH